MNTQFAGGLRALRQAKGMTQSELARRSGLARRTLTYWEAGDFLPRTFELKTALNALAATPEEAAQLIDLLETPRGLLLAETERTAQTTHVSMGAEVGIGDLLRAMRMRHRMTQAELAAQLRINRQSVLRWEAGQNLISPENLERLCDLLDAVPEERQALREHRLIMPHWEEDDWHKVTVEEAANLWRELQRPHHLLAPDYCPQTPLFELQVLAMKRHLHIHAKPGAAARQLLANLETDHAIWLHFHDRVPEAREYVNRALGLVREKSVPQDFWGEMLNLAVSKGYVKTAKWDRLVSLRLMEEWLPRLPPGFVRTQQLCDMAFYAGGLEYRSKALALMEQAQRSMDRAGEITASETYYYNLTMERVKLTFEHDREISEEFLAQCPNDFQRLHVIVLWIQSLLMYKETQTTLRYLSRAQSMLTPEMPTRMHLVSRGVLNAS